MMYGQVREHVYIYDKYLLSRLDWDVEPLLGLTFGWARKVSAESCLGVSFMIGLPGGSGMIKDYDWADKGDDEYLLNNVWTHYSAHPNNIESAFRINLDYISRLAEGEGRRLDYLLGIMWQHLSFEAQGGFYQYPPRSDPQNLTGLVSSYTTDIVLPVVGLMYSRSPGDAFAMSSLLKFGIAGFQLAYDQHHLRDIDFFDYYFLIPYIEARQSFALAFGNRNAVEFALFAVWYPKTYGSSYIKDLAEQATYRLRSTGAASSYFLGGEVSMHFSFGD